MANLRHQNQGRQLVGLPLLKTGIIAAANTPTPAPPHKGERNRRTPGRGPYDLRTGCRSFCHFFEIGGKGVFFRLCLEKRWRE